MSEGTEVERQAESWERCCGKIGGDPKSLGSYKPVTKSPHLGQEPRSA